MHVATNFFVRSSSHIAIMPKTVAHCDLCRQVIRSNGQEIQNRPASWPQPHQKQFSELVAEDYLGRPKKMRLNQIFKDLSQYTVGISHGFNIATALTKLMGRD